MANNALAHLSFVLGVKDPRERPSFSFVLGVKDPRERPSFPFVLGVKDPQERPSFSFGVEGPRERPSLWLQSCWYFVGLTLDRKQAKEC